MKVISLAVLLVATSATAEQSDLSDGITGLEMAQIVQEQFEQQGVSGEIAVAPFRTFPACDGTPAVEPQMGSWRTVKVSCSAPKWSRALRTTADMDVERDTSRTNSVADTLDAYVLRTSIPKGAVITDDMIELTQINSFSNDAVFSDKAFILGRKVKVNLNAGQAILARHLEQDWKVIAGAPVVIEFATGTFEILSSGEAMENGQLGDLIAVRSGTGQRTIRGIVKDENKIVVYTKMN